MKKLLPLRNLPTPALSYPALVKSLTNTTQRRGTANQGHLGTV